MTHCIHGDPVSFAPDDVIYSLPDSQGTIARHRCVICAYQVGVNVSLGADVNEDMDRCKHGSFAPKSMILQLPIYQGSAGRHKCVHCSYNAGLRAASLPEVVAAFQKVDAGVDGTETIAQVKVRIGQGLFRRHLLEHWRWCCAATGINEPQLIIASHLKPWAKCITDHDRLNKFNGLPLSPLWDKALDKGFVTFNDDGVPIVSQFTSNLTKEILLAEFKEPIQFPKESLGFLDWHRNNEFENFAKVAS